MFRWRGLIAAALVMVTLSGLSLGVGLLGAGPILENILGAQKKDLPQFAHEFNAKVAGKPLIERLALHESTIAGLPTGPFTALVIIMGLLTALTVVGSAANFLHAYLALTVVNRTVTHARRRAFLSALRGRLGAMLASGPSDAISRIVNDSAQLANGLNVLLSKAVLQIVKGVAGLAAALYFDWRVTVGALVIAPAMYTIIRKLGKRIRRASQAALVSQAGLLRTAGEALQALRVVKVHTTELYESGRFHRINKDYLRELNRVRTARALASPLTEMLTIFLLCGLVLLAANAIIKQNVSPKDFLLAMGALGVAGASLKPLTGIINDIQTAAPAAERLKELLDAPPEPGHERGLARLPRHAASIEFRAVRFTYPGANRPALDGVNLRIPHGLRFAIVGPNGCGKTTLLGLVPRLFDPDQGAVHIDGVDVRTVSVRSLRAQVGVVTQETVLFNASVRSNIAYGNPGATDAQVRSAARQARAAGFIESMAGGYDAVVAEGGHSLSGGQRQRVAIARAILRDPAILILDEATSMIDAESEAEIGAALEEFSRGRTCLVVAHRLGTVQRCDAIVVMDAGRVVDQGTHAELLTRCEVYRRLAREGFG